MANKVELPKDPNLAGKVIDAEHAGKIAEMGKVGAFFGSRDNAIIYLAASVVFITVVALAVIAFLEPSLRADAFKALAALALSALGYMFGSGGKRHD